MQGVKGKDVSYNTSCIGRATHIPMTPGLHTKTCTPLNSLPNSCIPTPLWLEDQRYKGRHLLHITPIFSLSLIEQSKDLSATFICPSLLQHVLSFHSNLCLFL